MVARNLLTACAGLGPVVLGIACSVPAATPGKVVEQGHPIDRAVLNGFQRGVTTRQEALDRLGEPTTSTVDTGDSSTTLSWHYVRQDANGTTAILAVLQFGADDVLQMKAVSMNAQTR